MFFCRNCGKELTGTPEICMNCGVKPIAGTSFCPWCGAPTMPLDEICTNCGVQLAKAISSRSSLFWISIEEKTWKLTVAGILSIIGGVGQVFGGIVFAVDNNILARFTEMEFIGGLIERFSGSYFLIGALLIVLGVIAIVGGICALRRRIWGLALAGSICALPLFVLGIPAIIFVILGKGEFKYAMAERCRWLLMLGKKMHDVLQRVLQRIWQGFLQRVGQRVLQRVGKAKKIKEYYYIKYTTSALRVIAWVILALGFIGSLVWGISTGGLGGGFQIVIGMIGSFLAWLLLLAARELLKLFMDVKENTINTAEGVAKKSR